MDDNIKIEKNMIIQHGWQYQNWNTWSSNMDDTIKIKKKHCIQIQEAHSERKKNMTIQLHITIKCV